MLYDGNRLPSLLTRWQMSPRALHFGNRRSQSSNEKSSVGAPVRTFHRSMSCGKSNCPPFGTASLRVANDIKSGAQTHLE